MEHAVEPAVRADMDSVRRVRSLVLPTSVHFPPGKSAPPCGSYLFILNFDVKLILDLVEAICVKAEICSLTIAILTQPTARIVSTTM